MLRCALWALSIPFALAACNTTRCEQLERSYDALRNASCGIARAHVPAPPAGAASAFLAAYRNFTGSNNETQALDAAAVLLTRPEVMTFLSLPDSFDAAAPGAVALDYHLVRCTVLGGAGGTAAARVATLAEFAAQGAAEEGLMGRLLQDGALMRDMLVGGGASGGAFGEATRIYEALLNASAHAHAHANADADADVNTDASGPRVQCGASPLGHNNSCLHNPWARLSGFPVGSVPSAAACCALCQRANSRSIGADNGNGDSNQTCVAWTYYDSTCNAFGAIDARAKVNPGSCISGGAMQPPAAPTPSPRPPPPPPPALPWDDRSPRAVLRRLALGTALEHAVPLGHMMIDTLIDPVARYLHYERAYLAGDLDPAFEVLTAFELRHVTSSPALDSELAWLRETLGNTRPDHAGGIGDSSRNSTGCNSVSRYAMAARTDVQYGPPHWVADPHNYSQIPAAGGECGPRAWFGRFARRAFGLPVWGVKQPGHACMATWSPEGGWAVLLGASWEHSWWDDQSGPDFALETEAREYRSVYQQVLRGAWAAAALGETPVGRLWTPRVPGAGYGSGGLWGAMALYHKKIAIARYGPPPPRPLGDAVVNTKVARLLDAWPQHWPTPNATTGANGTITVPGAAAAVLRNAKIQKSFGLDGQQLCSACMYAQGEGGAGEGAGAADDDYDFEFAVAAGATARSVSLSVNFSTWHVDQQLLLSVAQMPSSSSGGGGGNNDGATMAQTPAWATASAPVPVPVHWTSGYWNVTAPIEVQLAAGTNLLRFSRGNSTRGIAIKELYVYARGVGQWQK